MNGQGSGPGSTSQVTTAKIGFFSGNCNGNGNGIGNSEKLEGWSTTISNRCIYALTRIGGAKLCAAQPWPCSDTPYVRFPAQQKQLDAISQQISDLKFQQISDLKPMAAQIKNQQAKLDAMFDLVTSMAEQQRNSENPASRAPSMPSINVDKGAGQPSFQGTPFFVNLQVGGGSSKGSSFDAGPTGLV